METQIELTKTAVELARLEHRANIAKTEILRRPEREGSVRKQHSSFATVHKRQPRSSSPPVNNKNKEDINSIQTHGRIAQTLRAWC